MSKRVVSFALAVLLLSPVFSYSQTNSASKKADVPVAIEGLYPGEQMPALPQGPLLLTSVTPEMLNPNFWIDRLPNPDQVLKTQDQLKFFNEEIHMAIRER